MKYVVPFSLCLLFSIKAYPVSSNYQPHRKINKVDAPVLYEGIKKMGNEGPLTLAPKKKIRGQAGKHFVWKKPFALKFTKKKIKKVVAPPRGQAPKSQVTALLLAMFLGILGIHRFYLGYHGYATLMLLTLGLYGLLTVVDLVLIATGKLQPKHSGYVDSLD